MGHEDKGHLKLKNTIKNILENCSFEKVDVEVDIDLDDDGKIEFSIDACAIENSTLFVFQCKDTENLNDAKKELESTTSYMKKILSQKFNILKSSNIKNADLLKISDIKCCYAFTTKLDNKDTEKYVKGVGFQFWDHRTVKYYQRMSDILKELTKNEILREFGLAFSKKGSWEENAVIIKQGENNTMYLLGMHPGLLLKIAYVYRRDSNKSSAYQRLINKERLSNISKFFLSENDLLLANPVIIVFDQDDEEVQNRVKFDNGVLRFPVAYCSAWIIDGQHRIFGFKDHQKYKNWTIETADSTDFKIPVVAFKKLPNLEQNKTFININYYQKKIDPVLFNDLATVIKDMKNEITWPSLLVAELNKKGPWKHRVKISELDEKKSITISGFGKLKLLDTLLGYDKKTKTYNGPLFHTAQFDVNLPFEHKTNQDAFEKQMRLLNRFFTAVRNKVKDAKEENDMWINHKQFGLTKFTAVNALLLVLNALLLKDANLKLDLDKYMRALDAIDFHNDKLLKYGRGYPAMPIIANKIIKRMNSRYHANLNVIGIKKKRK